MRSGEEGAGPSGDDGPAQGTFRGVGQPDSTTSGPRWTFDRLPRVAWEHVAEIGAGGFLVYAALAHHADASGLCWPSLARISELTGFDPRHVRRTINRLIDSGLVTRDSRAGAVSRYRLVRSPTRDTQTPGLQTPGLRAPGPGTPRPPHPGHTDPGTRDTQTPRNEISERDHGTKPKNKTNRGAREARQPRKRGTRAPVEVPQILLDSIPGFSELWAERIRSMKRRPTASAEAKQLALLAAALPRTSAERVRAHVEHLVEAGWQTVAIDRLERDAGARNGSKPRLVGPGGNSDSRRAYYASLSGGDPARPQRLPEVHR